MKNLDLNLYCVQEMNEQEMLETDGGGTTAEKAVAVIGLVTTVVGVAALAVAGPAGTAAAIIVAPTAVGMAIASVFMAFRD